MLDSVGGTVERSIYEDTAGIYSRKPAISRMTFQFGLWRSVSLSSSGRRMTLDLSSVVDMPHCPTQQKCSEYRQCK